MAVDTTLKTKKPKQSESTWDAPSWYSPWLNRTRRTRLFADVHRLLKMAQVVADEAQRVADELDDCDPAAHPFREASGPAGNYAQALRVMADVTAMYAGVVDSGFVGVEPLSQPTPLPELE